MEGRAKMVAVREAYRDGTVRQSWINTGLVMHVKPVEVDSIPEARSMIEFIHPTTNSFGVVYAQDTADEIASKIGC